MRTLYITDRNPGSPPTDAENRALCRRARHGRTKAERLAARNELILRNQGLVNVEAQRFSTYLPFGDLMSEGQLGLIRAIEGYPLSGPAPFVAYAATAIRQAVGDYAWDQRSVIRAPRASKGDRESAVRTWDRERALSVGRLPQEVPARESIRASEEEREESRREVGRMLAVLTHRQRCILSAYYGLEPAAGMSMPEMLRHLGLSSGAVHQTRCAAEKKLRVVFAEDHSVKPCARCGDPGGNKRHNTDHVERFDGTRFGIPGKICRKCYACLNRIQCGTRKAVTA